MADEQPQMKPADWTTPHAKQWESWLAPYRGKAGVRGLEIGVCSGLTSEWLCRNILTGAGSGLDCVDHWRQYEAEEAAFDARTAGLPVRKFKGYSDAILPRIKADGNRYSLIYVDGSHHAETVLFDLVLGWSMLCRGGVLFADDYTLTRRVLRLPPRVAIDAFLACVADSMAGYEISRCGQVAVWKR